MLSREAAKFLKENGLSLPQMELLQKAAKFQLSKAYGDYYPTGMVQTFGIMDITLKILKEKTLIVNDPIYSKSEILEREESVRQIIEQAKTAFRDEIWTWKETLAKLRQAEALEQGNKRCCWQITFAGRKLVESYEKVLTPTLNPASITV